VLLWNVVPTHPGTATSNRAPTRGEVEACLPFLHELARGRRVVAVGRLAAAVTGAPYTRHPSHGGAAAFAAGLRRRVR
jgi:uracil-DNA glycosylase